MLTAAIGVAVMAIAVGLFWWSLPREGKTRFFINTAWEPLIAVAICSGGSIGLTLILTSVLGSIG